MSLVQMTLSGGAFILFIVVVRALALHRLPKGAFLALWEMAALRLLLPFTIPLPFSLFAPAKHLPVVGEYLAPGGVSVPETSAVGISAGTPASAGIAPSEVMPMVWLVGVALMAAYFTVSYVRARRRFRTATPDDTPAVRRWLTGRTLRRPLEVRQSALVSSPLTYGVLHPVILLPEDMERGDETTLTYILTHEFIHIRRFDSVAKQVFAAVLCVHWFNPLAWVMYVLANRDLELSCDERVMDTLGGREKASYALTLINMEEARSRCFSPYNHFSKLAIEERIEAIMKYKKASVLALALAVALVVSATTAFAASAAPSSREDLDRKLNAETTADEGTLMSYVDPKDGKTYYSFDGGKTFEAMTDEEFERRFPTPNVEWWTYEEYAAWLEQEYEGILQEIKEGIMYSKSVDGDENVMMSYNPADIESGTGKPVEADTGKVQAAAKVAMSDGYVFTSEKDGVPLDDWDVAQAPEYTPEEWQQIISDIESGKIPPFEMPDDPNVTVHFVDYPGGSNAEKD